MIFPEIAAFIFNGTPELDKNDELMNLFVTEFQKVFKEKKDFFERLTPSQLRRIPSFIEFCRDDHQVPNELAVRNYIAELADTFLENPDILATRQKGAPRAYKNESLSSSDLVDFANKPTVEQIQGRVRSQKDFVERDDRIELSSQSKMNQASRTWNKVATETRKSNKKEIESTDVKKKLLKKIMTLADCKSPEEAERLLEFTMQMIQRHSSIMVNFPTTFLDDDKFQKHRIMTAFEGAGTRNTTHIQLREKTEDVLASHTEDETKQKLKKNALARPRYGQLLLFGSNQIPGRDDRYGDSYMILDEKLKLESTFTLGDTLSAGTLKLSTIENLEIMLLDAGKVDFINIFKWAKNGAVLDNIRGAREYIEVQMPVVDLLDSDYVKSIHVNSGSKKLDQNVLEGFESIGIPIDNLDESSTFKIRDNFFKLIQNKKADPKEVKKFIERYTYLPKLRDTNGVTTLEMIAEHGNAEALNILVKELTGRSIAEWNGKELGEYEKHMFCKMLYVAVKNSNNEVVDILSKNINISELKDVDSNTPLMLAMIDKNENAGRNLILLGDDPNAIPRHFKLKHSRDGAFKKMFADYDLLVDGIEKKFKLCLKEIKKGISPENAIKKHFGKDVGVGSKLPDMLKSYAIEVDSQNFRLNFVEKFVALFANQDEIQAEKLSSIIIESLSTAPDFIKFIKNQKHVDKALEQSTDASKSK